MLMEVIASSLSLGCLGCGGVSVWYGLGPAKEDEIQSLYLLLGPLVMAPLAFLLGLHAGAEAWVYSGAIAVAGGFLGMLRSIVRRE